MKLSVITATRDRPRSLIEITAVSLLKQTTQEFEWVIVNDGGNPETKEAVRALRAPFKVVYCEIEHPIQGFGMCYARNQALGIASGDIVAYLDDDNDFYPDYIAETTRAFEVNPNARYLMCQQRRRRDIVLGDIVAKRGKEYTQPSNAAGVVSLIKEKDRFDSNGFAHYREQSLQWKPEYNLLADFEFFLRCVNTWGEDTFFFLPKVLVHYVQSSTGQVGLSTAGDALKEYEQLYQARHDYNGFQKYGSRHLEANIERFAAKIPSQRHTGFVL